MINKDLTKTNFTLVLAKRVMNESEVSWCKPHEALGQDQGPSLVMRFLLTFETNANKM